MNNKVSIGVVDDHPLILSGLRELLSKNKAIDSFTSFLNSVDLLEYLKSNTIDILIVDIRILNSEDGFSISSFIKSKYAHTKIIIYSGFVNQSYITEAMKIDVDAYVSKDSPIEEILLAIEKVNNGEKYYSNDVYQLIEFYEAQTNTMQLDLTEREIEILKLICKGLDYKQIADQLFISKYTVRSHRQNLMVKTKCHNIHDLYQFAIQNGLISIK